MKMCHASQYIVGSYMSRKKSKNINFKGFVKFILCLSKGSYGMHAPKSASIEGFGAWTKVISETPV